MQKTCTKCKQTKDISEFYKTGAECKICHKARCKIYIKAHPEKRTEIQMRYARSEKGKVLYKFQDKKSRQKYPEKIRARNAVNNAIRWKGFPRPSSLNCVKCGGKASQYHHHLGYEEKNWLDVIAVCPRCHKQMEHNI